MSSSTSNPEAAPIRARIGKTTIRALRFHVFMRVRLACNVSNVIQCIIVLLVYPLTFVELIDLLVSYAYPFINIILSVGV